MAACMCRGGPDCCRYVDRLLPPGEFGRVYRIPGWLKGISLQPTRWQRKRDLWRARRMAAEGER